MKQLYLENGYLNIEYVLRQGAVFNLIVGGRGTGKTYGALLHALEQDKKIIYMRRSQSQADVIRTPEFSPYNAINRERGESVEMFPITKYSSLISRSEYDEDVKRKKPCGPPLGYVCALSTISNLRGFDMSDCELLIFDEFIPEQHERPIKHEAEAFFNAYETVNRNRELQGKAPLRVLCLANSNELASPIIMALNVARKLEQMQEKGQQMSVDAGRSLALFNLAGSPISDAKRNTALYKLTSGSTFERMSLDNRFMRETGRNIKPRPLKEYRPIVSVGEVCIYVHKSDARLYVSSHTSGSPERYDAVDSDLDRLRKQWASVWTSYMLQMVDFEDYLCEVLFCQYFTGKRY